MVHEVGAVHGGGDRRARGGAIERRPGGVDGQEQHAGQRAAASPGGQVEPARLQLRAQRGFRHGGQLHAVDVGPAAHVHRRRGEAGASAGDHGRRREGTRACPAAAGDRGGHGGERRQG